MVAKGYALVTYLLISCGLLWAQDSSPENRRDRTWAALSKEAAGSNHAKTFAEALQDPNVVIGVFEIPYRIDLLFKMLPGDPLNLLLEYDHANNQLDLGIARRVKTIKGELNEPVIFFSRRVAGTFRNGAFVAPPFIPMEETQWILAIQTVPPGKRAAIFGEGIDKCSFINGQNLFIVRNFGYGALCLKRSPKDKLPILEVPEATVDDLDAIQKVMPRLKAAKTDLNEASTVNKTQKALKADVAKAIFEQILTDKNRKPRDPNSTSK